MNKIALIIPYFGKFPNYFPLFLNSCRKNATIDWLLITDIDLTYDYPENIRVIHMSFEQLRDQIQCKFDFEIALDTPYKLCDYKPAYGYLFEQELSGYNFWGYCDLDLLFGDLRCFFSDEILDRYDKIGHLGHLTIYRNTPEINRAFMSEFGALSRYREVLSSNQIFVFDEWDELSINRIFLRKGLRLWIWNDFFDACPRHDNLVRTMLQVDANSPWATHRSYDRRETYVTWEDGSIYARQRRNGTWEKTELAYAHFQKRDMAVRCAQDEQYILCLPDGFEPFQGEIPPEHRRSNRLHRVIDRKRFKYYYSGLRYRVAVATAPIRHRFKKYV